MSWRSFSLGAVSTAAMFRRPVIALVDNSLNWCHTLADVLSSLAASGRQLAEQTIVTMIKTIHRLSGLISLVCFQFVRMRSAFDIFLLFLVIIFGLETAEFIWKFLGVTKREHSIV